MEISHRAPQPYAYTPYEGPRHIPEPVRNPAAEEYYSGAWSEPAVGPGYLPGAKLLKELGFFTEQGFTGWMRRDEAHPVGYHYLRGKRLPFPNFHMIAAWGRITGSAPDAQWRLIDSFAFKEEVSVAAPRNDAEFWELAAMFDRAYNLKTHSGSVQP